MGEALRIIRERDGWKGLRRGMLPRVLTVAPSTAISWMSYEFFSEYMSITPEEAMLI
jgi:solute carrier family 25 iron transporter 28/37